MFSNDSNPILSFYVWLVDLPLNILSQMHTCLIFHLSDHPTASLACQLSSPLLFPSIPKPPSSLRRRKQRGIQHIQETRYPPSKHSSCRYPPCTSMEHENYGMNLVIEGGVRTFFAMTLKLTNTDVENTRRLPGSELLTQGHQDLRLNERLRGHGTR